MLNSCHDLKQKADLIIYNTLIYTLDSSDNKASSLAIRDGIILAVGNDAEIRSRYWSDENINAKGLVVYPGFIDAHSHFSGFAQFLRYADLSKAESYKDVLSILKDYHNSFPDRWIIGRGWDQNKWPGKQFPDNSELNQLFPDIPVVLTRVDGHAVLANDAAIRKAGLTPPFSSGEALLFNGKSTGIFLEHTADRLKAVFPQPSDIEMTELLQQAAALCHQVGLTGVNDAGIDKETILLYDTLLKSGALQMRIDAMINPTEENMDYFMKGRGYRTPFLRVGSVKIYADGALGSRGACLLAPYSDDPGNKGIMVIQTGEMRAICNRAHENGFQVNTHAIGDSAIRKVLSVYASILGEKNDLRWRIEHAQVVNEKDFDLFGKYSIIPSVQGTHATSDMTWAHSRLGTHRLKNAYAYQKLMMQNGWLANGTDFPVESIDPLATFYATVSRKDADGNPPDGFQKENALSRLDALKSITCWAAKAAFEEQYRGSIEVDKSADLVILDKDILSIPENEILSTKVTYTILDGKIVYSLKKK
jgi:predicted amidohydrolase YtcJ